MNNVGDARTWPLAVDPPWRASVGARRRARQQGISLDEYITGLIEADLAVDAEQMAREFASNGGDW